MRRYLLAVVAMWCVTNASATVITFPTGLNPGDQYRLAFVTSGTRDATSTNINDYNDFVSAAANAIPELAALGTDWFALASTDAVAARDNTGTLPTFAGGSLGVPIYLLNDVRLFDSNDDLWGPAFISMPFVPFNRTELDTELPPFAFPPSEDFVWTGSTNDGRPQNALGGLPSDAVNIGDQSTNDVFWIRIGNTAAVFNGHFYALSAPLTAPTSVPEPPTLVILVLALGVLGCVRRQTMKRSAGV